MLDSLVNLLSTYQTLSIIFVSSFLTIICLTSKKKEPSGSASTFNTIENLNEKQIETEIEVIALDNNKDNKSKSLDNSINSANHSATQNNKSRIPIRRNNQISNSFDDANSSKKLKVTYDNDNSNSKTSINNNRTNLFTVSSSNSPLDVSINNSTSNPSSAATQIVNLTPNTSARKSFNNIKPSSNDDSNTNSKQNTNKSPQINRNANTPTKIEIIHEDDNKKPSVTSGLPPKNPTNTQFNPRPSIASVNSNTNTNSNTNPNTNSNLTSSNSFNSGNANRFRNSIVDVNGRISANINTNRVQINQQDAKTGRLDQSPIAENNSEDSKQKDDSTKLNESTILAAPKILKKAMDKIQPKSNLKNKDKSSYKLLHNENNNHIKKNKKSVKFHNKVEVWARTPTFLYSEKSFIGDRDLDDYDDDDEVDNLKRIRIAAQSGRRLFLPDKSLTEPIPIVAVPRPLAATSMSQANGYSSRLRTKMAVTANSVPANQFTDTTIPVIPAYPAHFRPAILQPRIGPFTPFRPGPAPIAISSNLVGQQQSFLFNPIRPTIAIRNEAKPSPQITVRQPTNKPAPTVK